jgi:hypothetical protein
VLSRRDLLGGTGAFTLASCAGRAPLPSGLDVGTAADWRALERRRIAVLAQAWAAAEPVTITSYLAPRSPGDAHAYYSEGDYWWPDPDNPGGPYVRRDGLSNPDRFDSHRQALIRMAQIVPALTAHWLAAGDGASGTAVRAHLASWFVNPTTRMAPHLEHAQAIIGVNTGRGIGIIDTVHLAEVARSYRLIRDSGGLLDTAQIRAIDRWFADYLMWLRTSANGQDEADERNNHGSCYVLQCAAFAGATGDQATLDWCRARLLQLVVDQIAADGRQPLELARTKPYGYSLFNLDILATCAWILSEPGDLGLWHARSAESGSIASALAYMAPFIAEPQRWPHGRDVAFMDDWPIAHPALLFAAMALQRADYQALWMRLNPQPTIGEIIRNMPIRQPLLWDRS